MNALHPQQCHGSPVSTIIVLNVSSISWYDGYQLEKYHHSLKIQLLLPHLLNNKQSTTEVAWDQVRSGWVSMNGEFEWIWKKVFYVKVLGINLGEGLIKLQKNNINSIGFTYESLPIIKSQGIGGKK